MYTPSRHFMDFHISGFTYWEGAEVFGKLSVGNKLEVCPENDNPYDPDAVALYFGKRKIGYIPRHENSQISMFLFFGHSPFEAYVSQINPEAHPERQVRVVLKIKDNRDEATT